jgi:hypothetical protein
VGFQKGKKVTLFAQRPSVLLSFPKRWKHTIAGKSDEMRINSKLSFLINHNSESFQGVVRGPSSLSVQLIMLPYLTLPDQFKLLTVDFGLIAFSWT